MSGDGHEAKGSAGATALVVLHDLGNDLEALRMRLTLAQTGDGSARDWREQVAAALEIVAQSRARIQRLTETLTTAEEPEA